MDIFLQILQLSLKLVSSIFYVLLKEGISKIGKNTFCLINKGLLILDIFHFSYFFPSISKFWN